MTANAMDGDREMCLAAGHERLPQQADPAGRRSRPRWRAAAVPAAAGGDPGAGRG